MKKHFWIDIGASGTYLETVVEFLVLCPLSLLVPCSLSLAPGQRSMISDHWSMIADQWSRSLIIDHWLLINDQRWKSVKIDFRKNPWVEKSLFLGQLFYAGNDGHTHFAQKWVKWSKMKVFDQKKIQQKSKNSYFFIPNPKPLVPIPGPKPLVPGPIYDIWYHIKSYHDMSSDIIWNDIMRCDGTSHAMIPYDMVWYHTI